MAKAASEVPIEVIRSGTGTLSFKKLPSWMKDNEFQFGHRPELNTSKNVQVNLVFTLKLETSGLISLDLLLFVLLAIIFYVKPLCDKCHLDLELREKLIFVLLPWSHHLLRVFSSSVPHSQCHSEHISKLFCKLDYVGNQSPDCW